VPQLLQRIGLLGDIHAEDASLAVALQMLADAGVDRVVAVGDIVDGPGSVERCCELLAGADVAVVRGNHERWFLAGTMRELPYATREVGAQAGRYLAALPGLLRFPVAGGEIRVCHGLGADDMASVDLDADAFAIGHNPPLAALVEEDQPIWVLNGHSHRPGVWSYGALVVVNGGTLFREHQPCFGLVDLGREEVTYFEVDRGRLGPSRTVPLPPPRCARGGGRRAR
jgi:predicted phosphodiesterase